MHWSRGMQEGPDARYLKASLFPRTFVSFPPHLNLSPSHFRSFRRPSILPITTLKAPTEWTGAALTPLSRPRTKWNTSLFTLPKNDRGGRGWACFISFVFLRLFCKQLASVAGGCGGCTHPEHHVQVGPSGCCLRNCDNMVLISLLSQLQRGQLGPVVRQRPLHEPGVSRAVAV